MNPFYGRKFGCCGLILCIIPLCTFKILRTRKRSAEIDCDCEIWCSRGRERTISKIEHGLHAVDMAVSMQSTLNGIVSLWWIPIRTYSNSTSVYTLVWKGYDSVKPSAVQGTCMVVVSFLGCIRSHRMRAGCVPCWYMYNACHGGSRRKGRT